MMYGLDNTVFYQSIAVVVYVKKCAPTTMEGNSNVATHRGNPGELTNYLGGLTPCLP